MSDTKSTSVEDLKPKQKFTGTVKKVELYGALVDIGDGREGLVHISQLKEGRVNNVAEAVSEGDEVTVWVRRTDKDSGRIDLTMIEPPAVSWGDLKEGQTVTGKVVRLEKFGAFVEIGAERPGLVHVSELAEGYVKSPSDVVKVGDEVEARVIGVNRKKGRIDLSLKALQPTMAMIDDEEEEEGETLTAFALAYQRAVEQEQGADEAEEEKPVEATDDRKRRQQEDLLARTLEQHRDRD